MLYTELLALTDGKATYEQFEDIEAVYMTKEEMTKQQAACLWKRRYGEKVEKLRPAEMKAIKDAIRSFKHEREWGKTLESRIIEAHNKKIKNHIEGNGVEFDENGYAKEYWEVSGSELTIVFGLTYRRVQQMAQDGIITPIMRGKYNLADAVQSYPPRPLRYVLGSASAYFVRFPLSCSPIIH